MALTLVILKGEMEIRYPIKILENFALSANTPIGNLILLYILLPLEFFQKVLFISVVLSTVSSIMLTATQTHYKKKYIKLNKEGIIPTFYTLIDEKFN